MENKIYLVITLVCISSVYSVYSAPVLIRAIGINDSPSAKTSPKFSGCSGAILFGYVNGGGYLNFTGPNVNLNIKHHKIILGMLPSLRFKQDNSEVRNTFVTPNLGVGLTYSYKKIALQIPLYYNAKTNNNHGRWHIGAGIGIQLN